MKDKHFSTIHKSRSIYFKSTLQSLKCKFLTGNCLTLLNGMPSVIKWIKQQKDANTFPFQFFKPSTFICQPNDKGLQDRSHQPIK